MEIESSQNNNTKNNHRGNEVISFPQIMQYISYRKFVRDWFHFKKQHRSGFSYRRFSALLGLKSPNFLQLVLSGERNISLELASTLSQKMNLSAEEQKYFLIMIQYEQAKSEDEKIKFERELLIAKKNILTNQCEKARIEVLSQWYHMLVRELVFLPHFEPSGEFISQALNGIISPDEAEQSFRLLLESGFVENLPNNRYRTVDLLLDTGNFHFSRTLMASIHAQTLLKWSQNLERLNPKEQELGILHIPIASEKLSELKNRIRRFQDEIIGWLCEEANPDRVVQLGTYLIPFKDHSS